MPSIFIGHGRSPQWRELQQFLSGELGLPCDDFEAVSVAGMTITDRLDVMAEEACFAFLVMTAEVEHVDGTRHARENVIHEVGLFQSRLGSRKAIILLEERCAEPSNFHGLPITESVVAFAQALVQKNALPAKALDDSLHIAVSAVHGVDYLLTWNFRHLDNAETKPIVRSVCSIYGYISPEICTPQELMGVIDDA